MECLKVVTWGILVFVGGLEVINRVAATDCVVPTYVSDLPQDRFLTHLTAPCRYDKYITSEPSIPLDVTMRVDIKHLEVEQTQYTAHLTVQLMYEDQRLNYENLTTTKSVIIGGEEVKEKIWTPRLQLKDQNDTTVVESKEQDFLVLIDKKGYVIYSYKVVVTFYCWMNLKKFPFDSQKCTLSFSDWSYNNKQLKLIWNNNSSSTSIDDFHFSGFVLDEIEYTNGNTDSLYQISTSSLGSFSEVTIKLNFHRDSGYYVLSFYLPSYLLIFTAWITFWLQADAGPPRAILGTSTVIAFVTLHLGLSKEIPKVSYIKASDIWFLAVSCFIFFSLAEFAFVNVIWRRKKIIELREFTLKYILKSALRPSQSREDLKRYESKMAVISASQNELSNGLSKSISQETLAANQTVIPISEKNGALDFNWATMTPQEVAIYIDRKARIVFPVCFLMFNLIYWLLLKVDCVN